jgi:hypothetical protein
MALGGLDTISLQTVEPGELSSEVPERELSVLYEQACEEARAELVEVSGKPDLKPSTEAVHSVALGLLLERVAPGEELALTRRVHKMREERA